MKISPQFWMCFRLFKFFLWTTYNFGQIFACIFMLFFMSSLISYLRMFASSRLGRDRMVVGLELPICNQCLSPLTLWVWTPFMARCQWLVTDWRFSPSTTVSSINKTDRHDNSWNIVESGAKHHPNTHNPDVCQWPGVLNMTRNSKDFLYNMYFSKYF